jgi:hypothetical protein
MGEPAETPVQHGGMLSASSKRRRPVGAVEQFIEVVVLERQLAGASGR